MDLREMIEAIRRQRMNLSESEILQMVEEKKRRIGAGYLTDQGALFLVAADLGITLESPKLEMSLKDLYAGAREVTVIARIMKVYPPRRYARKDGSEANLRTLVVYDNESSVRVSLWDDAAKMFDTLDVKPGDAVRIAKAYVKSGLDGKNAINAGSRSTLEVVRENVPHIGDLDSITIDASEIAGSEETIAVTGALKSSPRISDFVNFRGQPSKSMQMQIAGTDGKTIRVVLWNVDEQRVPKVLRLGAKLRLVGVRPKRNQYGDLELHGDEGTLIELYDGQQEEIEVMPLRIISVSRGRGAGKSFAVAIDRAKRVFTLAINDNFAGQLQKDGIVECVPSSVYGSTLVLGDDAYVRTTEDDPAFPNATALERKIREIKPSQDELYFLEAMTLTPSKTQEIQLRDGSSAKYAETLLGDDTGEVRLVGWRDLVGTVEKLGTGQRVKVYGVTAYTGRDGNIELRLKPYSNITVI